MTNGSIIPAAFWGQPIPGLITCQSSQPPSRKESSFHREEGTYIQTRADAERRLHTDTRRCRKAPPYRHVQRQKGATYRHCAQADTRTSSACPPLHSSIPPSVSCVWQGPVPQVFLGSECASPGRKV